MKPTNEALQVFYGTLPLIVVVIAAWLRESMLLKDILARLGRLETALQTFKDEVRHDLSEIKQRLTVLETRAGGIFHN
jgi:hypothetical protein